MKNIYLFILCSSLSLASFAQSNYKKGLVVNAKGDTVHGFINYKEWGQNPKSIEFKPDLATAPQNMGVADISYFAVDGFEYYQRYTVSISLDEVDLQNIQVKGIDTAYKTEAVFLKVMEKGKNITLYSYVDAVKPRYYYKDNAMTVPQELIYKRYVEDGKSFTRETFRRQLTALVSTLNLTDLIPKIQTLDYDGTELSKMALRINGSTQKQAAMASANEHPIKMFIGAGVNLSIFKYEGASPFPNSMASTSVFPKITFGIDDYINPNVGRFVLRAELGFTMNSFSVSSANSINGFRDTTSQKIKQATLSLTPQVIYNVYNTDALKVFIDVGFAINLSSYPTNAYTDVLHGATVFTTTQTNFPQLQSAWFAVPIKAGVTINKKLELYAAYTAPLFAVTNNYQGFSAGITTVEAGFNYFFK